MNLDEMKAEITRLEGLHKASTDANAKLTAEITDLTTHLDAANGKLKTATDAMLAVEKERDSLRSEVVDLTAKLKTATDSALAASADFEAKVEARLKEELPKAAAKAGFSLVPARNDGKPDTSKLTPRERLELATNEAAARLQKRQ